MNKTELCDKLEDILSRYPCENLPKPIKEMTVDEFRANSKEKYLEVKEILEYLTDEVNKALK